MSAAYQHLPFGLALTDTVSISAFRNGEWSDFTLAPAVPVLLHPAAHVLRRELVAIQQGGAPDPHGWLTRVEKQ